MKQSQCRIGVVATGSRADADMQAGAQRLAARLYGEAVEVVFHPNSFLTSGHFGGDDAARAAAFLEIANDPAFDALWFARGGYGACRLLDLVMPRLTEAAKAKAYLGYSDAGSLLGALHQAGFPTVAHGPMPTDLRRSGGEAAVERALRWLVERDARSLEASVGTEGPALAFNLVILTHLVGTRFMPDLAGKVLMIEEVAEHMYRIDRDLCQLASSDGFRRLKGLRLGRCSDIPPNDPDFVLTEEEVARFWCERTGVAYLGRADIGHDAGNKVVPFG